MIDGLQDQLAGKTDLVNGNFSYHRGLLLLNDVEYWGTVSYPIAAMLSSVMIPIQTNPRTHRIGVK